jgi:hypothetical protein
VAYPALDDWSITFWRTKSSLVGRCDPELDLRTKIGLGRPKTQTTHNGFKIDVCVGLIDTNPTKLE